MDGSRGQHTPDDPEGEGRFVSGGRRGQESGSPRGEGKAAQRDVASVCTRRGGGGGWEGINDRDIGYSPSVLEDADNFF